MKEFEILLDSSNFQLVLSSFKLFSKFYIVHTSISYLFCFCELNEYFEV
jgi:hypothetical protein